MERVYRLLIVEDDLPIQDLLTKVAAMYGFDADTAGDGDDGLKKIATGKHDVILLDILLPKLSGVEIVKNIRNTMPRLLRRMILMTAGGEAKLRECGNLGDFWCVRRKPLDIVELAREMTLCATQ